VIIVQENRTPDNLFGTGAPSGGLCSGQDDFEPGVDIQDWGYIGSTPTCFSSLPLANSVNPGHQHGDFKNDYAGGNLNACSDGTTDCYSFTQKSDVLPYFQIATTYGFANYFFQTNEGPSFEAHQFLFGGTSGPVGTNTQGDFHDWFAADNPILAFSNNTGCSSNDPNQLGYVDGVKFDGTTATGSSSDPWYVPLPLLRYSYPCYEHNTLADLLGNNGVSWRYYAPEEGSIWSAPTAIYHLCGGLDAGPCPNFQPGGEYANYVTFEGPKGTDYSTAPVFRDIANCNLAEVSWVIPDEKWSDHPDKNDGSGPDYVGSIVNAIGQGMSTSTCNPLGNPYYWNNTAILIVWDDWGGWHDHVNPATAPGLWVKEKCTISSWGCGDTYGFRVPLLVVSPWTGVGNQNTGYSGYVSGNTQTQGEVTPYIHDFGSILAFIEHNFSIPIGSINTTYPFADNFAPEWQNGRNIPLSDFFGLATRRPFVPITVSPSHPLSYFTNNPVGPEGPGDNGDAD